MRRFCIDSSVLGTSRHIVGDSEGFVWSDSVPRDAWHMTGSLKLSPTSKCLDTLFELVDHVPTKVPERHMAAMVSVMSGSFVPVPWQHALPEDDFRIFFKNLVQETTSVFPRLPFSYYESSWVAASRVLSALRTARVDVPTLQQFLESPGQTAHVAEGFRPGRTGFTHPVTYDRFGTRTGRLTVTSGPNILGLKRDYKTMLRSSFPDGVVCSLDFRALEARIVLAESGKFSASEDMYEDIAQQQFGGRVDRKSVKVAVLADLYGISRGTLKSKLAVSDAAVDDFISTIREFFGTDALKKRLRQEAETSSTILNRFGRPLRMDVVQDNLLVNTYAQSSGVDLAFHGFDKILRDLGPDGIRPLYVLHDAVILDVRRDRLVDVQTSTSVDIPTYDMPFPLKFEQVSPDP